MNELLSHSITYRIAVGPQRGRKVFTLQTLPACGGALRVIACMEHPEVIEKILNHLNAKQTLVGADPLPESRAPPQTGLFERWRRTLGSDWAFRNDGHSGVRSEDGKPLEYGAR